MERLFSLKRMVTENGSAIGQGDALLIALLMELLFIVLVFAIELVLIVKLYRKIGVSPWVILIPVYNIYVLFKAFGVRKWFWIIVALYAAVFGMAYLVFPYIEDSAILFALMFVFLFISVLLIFAGMLHYTYNMARAFGKGFSFFCGLLLLYPIFYLILIFGKSEYVGVPE